MEKNDMRHFGKIKCPLFGCYWEKQRMTHGISKNEMPTLVSILVSKMPCKFLIANTLKFSIQIFTTWGLGLGWGVQ
jgi:hypothetical protein